MTAIQEYPDGPIPEIRNMDDNQINVVLKQVVDAINSGAVAGTTGITGPTGPFGG